MSQVFFLLPAWNHFPLDHNAFHNCPGHTLPSIPPASLCFPHTGAVPHFPVGVNSLSVGCEPGPSGSWPIDSCFCRMSYHQSSVFSRFHDPTLFSFLCSGGSPPYGLLRAGVMSNLPVFPITESGFSKEVLDRARSLKACVFFSSISSNTQQWIPIKKQFDLGSCLPSRLLDLQEESSCVWEDLIVAVSCNGKNHCISGVSFQASGLVPSAIKQISTCLLWKVAVGVGRASGWERGNQRGTMPKQSKHWGDGSEIFYSKC